MSIFGKKVEPIHDRIRRAPIKVLLPIPIKGDFYGNARCFNLNEAPVGVRVSPLRWYERNKNLWAKNGSFLCGGALVDLARGETPRDLDMYFRDETSIKRTLHEAANNGYIIEDQNFWDLARGVYQIVIKHPGDKSMYPDLNMVVSQYFGDIEHVLGLFDLDICCVGVCSDTFTYTVNWHRSFADKVFQFHVVRNMLVTQKRVLKYAEKGFTFVPCTTYKEIPAGQKFY